MKLRSIIIDEYLRKAQKQRLGLLAARLGQGLMSGYSHLPTMSMADQAKGLLLFETLWKRNIMSKHSGSGRIGSAARTNRTKKPVCFQARRLGFESLEHRRLLPRSRRRPRSSFQPQTGQGTADAHVGQQLVDVDGTDIPRFRRHGRRHGERLRRRRHHGDRHGNRCLGSHDRSR